MPEVSIVIPFHNRIDWVKEAVQSVIEQTIQDLEIIVVDDGSDENYEVEIKQMDKRIIYLRQKRSGPSSARNAGIKAATSVFIAFLDSDDLFLAEKLQKQLKVMQDHSSVMLSHTSHLLMDEKKKQLGEVHSGLFAGIVYPHILTRCPIATPTVMVRREVLQNNLFDESIGIAEDVLLWAKISKYSQIIGIDENLTKVRIHDNSTANNPEKQREAFNNLIRLGIMPDTEINIQDRKYLLSNAHLKIGFTYFEQKEFCEGVRFIEKSLLEWPPNFKILLFIIGQKFITALQKIIPKSVRSSIKNIFKGSQ